MAETLIKNPNTESQNFSHQDNGSSESPSDGFRFRRIEFHLARKPFTGFANGGGGNFRLETLNPTSSNPAKVHGSGQVGGSPYLTGKKRDGLEIVENGLDPELSFGITFRRIGAGLENLGNTCFLNSVLQCLTYTEPLAAYLQSGKHQVSCRNAGFCALCAIQKHVSRALQSTGRILAPKDLVSNLRCISRNFRNSRQEDAHEYMVNLLESMHKCCLPSGVPSESASAYEKSLVHKIFGGRLRSQVKCMQCSHCSDKFDPFLDLSLEIAKADNLYKAFENFTAKEQLDGGGRQYQCQHCNQKVKALKQLTIDKAPYVLTIHLKRFGSHISGQKIDKKIQFGPTLDLRRFVSGSYDGDLKYTLYGVLVHAGWSTHSGHYYCFVRTSSGMWYSLDDNQVVQVSEKKVFEQKAYMLFYFRDRKSAATKKPVDVIQKERMVINGMGRITMYPNINERMRDTIRSSALEKTSNGPNSSFAVPPADVLIPSASKDAQMKGESVQKMSSLTRCSALNSAFCLESSEKVPPPSDLVKGAPLPQSGLSVEGSSHTLKQDGALNMSSGAKLVECSMENNTKKDLSTLAAIPSSCNGLQTFLTKRDTNEILSISLNCKENKSTNEDISVSAGIPANCKVSPTSPAHTYATEKTSSAKESGTASLLDPDVGKVEKVDLLMSGSRTNREDILIEDFSKEVAGVQSLCISVSDDGQRIVDSASAVSSSLPKIKSSPLREKAVADKPHRKLKKTIMKCKGTSMHLGKNILLGTSLSFRKKKKHKRSRKCTSLIKNKNLRQEDLLNGNCIPMDVGPSSSKITESVPLSDGLATRKKRVKSDSKNEDKTGFQETVGTSSSVDFSVNSVDKEYRERFDRSDAVLATVNQQENGSTSALAGCQSDSRDPMQQNKLMSMLTRGLEERTVARWDEIEISPFRRTESSGMRRISIGYVGDEWDEDYDKGKRKKVRASRDQFDGQNPFQEIATKKAKLNHAKLEQPTSRNGPFRI